MKTKLIIWTALATLALAAVSCSKDDDNGPGSTGTVTLNMMNENNGKTFLGSSSIYIDRSNNFNCSSDHYIADLGKKGSAGSIGGPVFTGLARQIAVTPGHGYVAYDEDAIKEFPSGTYAIAIDAAYYRFHVRSFISDEDKITGATVSYISTKPKTYNLPAYDTNIGTIYPGESSTIELPSKEFEYILDDKGHEYMFHVEKKNNLLTISLISSQPRPDTFSLYIRIKETYTVLQFDVR